MIKVESLLPKQKASKALVIGFVIIFVVVLSSYLARGWIRVTAVPKTIQLFEAHSLRVDTTNELSLLAEPFSSLGYETVNKSPSACYINVAQNFSEEVGCSYTLSAYDVIPQNDATKTTLDAASKKVENALQKNGWTGEYSDTGQYVSLHKLVTNITNGIDYTPDASYYKQSGPLMCVFQATTAFARPKPPAMSLQISCNKTYKVFGAVIF